MAYIKYLTEEIIEEDTQKLLDWLIALDVDALTLNDATTVDSMNVIFFMMTESQKAFIAEEYRAKLDLAIAKIAELRA